MTPSLKALLTGLIDYAGLFPPANLSLPEAVGNHARYRAEGDAWMLGRFICPAARLAELAAFEDERLGFTISALGRASSADGFLAGLSADLADIAACRERHGGRVAIDVLEVRLPGGRLTSRDALAGTAKLTQSAELSLFFETPSPGPEELPALLRTIRDAPFARPAGFKLRCGGTQASAFPSCEQIAFALTACLKEDVPFKATAGLHHPFPRFDSSVQAKMHGFVNLFTAGVLASARSIDAGRVRAILEDDDPRHFLFDDSGLRWRELVASTEEIALARGKAVLSFGSCSFDEPRDDFRSLGWL
jgi:hypothetical protein